jgi:ankyrin repeat protein
LSINITFFRPEIADTGRFEGRCFVSHIQPQAKILPARPNLGFLKKLAKERLASLRADRPAAKLAHAQLAVAREHGFASWRKLKAEVERRARQTTSISAETLAAFSNAIRSGDVAALKRSLRGNPALANADTGAGETALHLAAGCNQAPVVKLLLSAGADPSAKLGRSGHTPLSWAVTVGSFDAASALVKAGIKADLFCAAGMGDLPRVKSFFAGDGSLIAAASQTGSSRYDSAGNLLPCPPTTDIEIASDALYAAARNGRAEVVRFLLAQKPDLAFRAYMGGTPLHWAYYSGSKETVDLLLAAGADPLLQDNAVKCSPRAFGICIPANWGIERIVRHQLAQDPSLANIPGGRGTPLHEAARGRQPEIIKLLLAAGADPRIKDPEGKTPVDIAKEKGHAAALELLQKGVHPNPPADDTVYSNRLHSAHHDTFLDAAVPRPDSHHKSGSLEPARKLLADHPEIAGTSIFAACASGDVKTVARLLANDRSLASAVGGVRNWPPLCYLTFSRFLRDQKRRAREFVKCAKLLLNAGANPNSSWPSPNDATYRESALYGAAGVANCVPLTKLLLQAGADVNDDEALYHASEFTDNAALRVLLAANPRRDWVSYNLCHKMDMEDPAGVKLFIKHGADVNFLIERGLFKGSRPLHFAIYRRRSLKVFRLLLQAGADPNLADSKGVTPYQLARKLGLNPVARLLKSKGAIDDLDQRTQFLAALSSGGRKTASAMLRHNPELKDGLAEHDHKFLVDAGEAGNVNAVRLMLDMGFPITARGTSYGGWDATALDQAAWNGHGAVVRLLLKRGADPTVKHGYGGDALGAAIHGANHNGHLRGLGAVKALAAVATNERLAKAVEYAKTEPNQKVTALLEKLRQERNSTRGSIP